MPVLVTREWFGMWRSLNQHVEACRTMGKRPSSTPKQQGDREETEARLYLERVQMEKCCAVGLHSDSDLAESKHDSVQDTAWH